jgi:hypothetical protein
MLTRGITNTHLGSSYHTSSRVQLFWHRKQRNGTEWECEKENMTFNTHFIEIQSVSGFGVMSCQTYRKKQQHIITIVIKTEERIRKQKTKIKSSERLLNWVTSSNSNGIKVTSQFNSESKKLNSSHPSVNCVNLNLPVGNKNLIKSQ